MKKLLLLVVMLAMTTAASAESNEDLAAEYATCSALAVMLDHEGGEILKDKAIELSSREEIYNLLQDEQKAINNGVQVTVKNKKRFTLNRSDI